MFFFSFQQFLSYFHKQNAGDLEEQVFHTYLCQYVDFCKQHHMMDNVRDVHRERAMAIFPKEVHKSRHKK